MPPDVLQASVCDEQLVGIGGESVLSGNRQTNRKIQAGRSRKRYVRFKNEERRHKIESILSHFRGSKNVLSIKTRRKKVLLTHMQDKASNNKEDRQDVADVLEEFCEVFYTSTTKI